MATTLATTSTTMTASLITTTSRVGLGVGMRGAVVDIDPARHLGVVAHGSQVVHPLADLTPDVGVAVAVDTKAVTKGRGDGESSDSGDEVAVDIGFIGERHKPECPDGADGAVGIVGLAAGDSKGVPDQLLLFGTGVLAGTGRGIC
jgi:hypothetical protein